MAVKKSSFFTASEFRKQSGKFMAKIGIFWIYNSKIIGKSCELEDGQENLAGMIDSPYTHLELWENDPSFIIPFPELIGSEYQLVPRGRVLYSVKYNKVFVYMDKVLHSEETKKIIVNFFQIGKRGQARIFQDEEAKSA